MDNPLRAAQLVPEMGIPQSCEACQQDSPRQHCCGVLANTKIVYLPGKLQGTPVMDGSGESGWRVTNDYLKSKADGITARKSKNLEDHDTDWIPWETVLHNACLDDDGWLRFEIPVRQEGSSNSCDCSVTDAFAPSPIVVQSFGLPSRSSGRDIAFSKTPMSSASDWSPRRVSFTAEYQTTDFHGTENIEGQPSLEQPQTPQISSSSRALRSIDEESVLPASPNNASYSPQAAAAGNFLQAPTPQKMQAPLQEPTASPVKESKEWRQDMTQHEVLEEAIWCWYCIFQGCGVMHEASHPKTTCQTCCCQSECESIPFCSVGCWQCVTMMGCCTCFSECPPQESPCCMACGDPCVDFCPRQPTCCRLKTTRQRLEQPDATEDSPAPSRYAGTFQAADACFCCCCGCGNCCSLGCCEMEHLCCCSRCDCSCTPPSCRDCSCLVTCAQMYGQCWCPPKMSFNPCCALCGLRCFSRERDKQYLEARHARH